MPETWRITPHGVIYWLDGATQQEVEAKLAEWPKEAVPAPDDFVFWMLSAWLEGFTA